MSYKKEQFIEDFKNAYNQSQQLHYLYRYLKEYEGQIASVDVKKLEEETNNIAYYQFSFTLDNGNVIETDSIAFASYTFVNELDNRVISINNTITSINNTITSLDRRIDNTEDDLQNIHDKMLTLPSTAPSTRKVVTIDTNGAQDNVDGTALTTLMSNIVDSHGNKRFIEGNLGIKTIEGYTFTYYKWSLSGSHLMLVVAGTCTGITRQPFVDVSVNDFPSYISNKIVAMFGIQVSFTNAIYRATDAETLTTPITAPCVLTKDSVNLIYISMLPKTNIFDSTKTYAFRIQFDLLIDSE